jgi:CRP/FNR family transcriptional regulator, cyclic AMP receptor protein
MDTNRLAELPLFEGLDDDSLRAIAKSGHELSVQEGAEIVREGDYSYELTVIDEGQAEVISDGQVVATLGPGDVFGEVGVVRKDLRNATVRAATPLRLFTLTGWDLRRLRNRMPELAERIEALAAERS